jgi:hypothetical protein
MLHAFYIDVAKVDLDVAYTCILQAYVSNVADVSYVYCKCFIWVLHMFAMLHTCFRVFSAVLHKSVWDVCCKCFSFFWKYVASISSECSKSRSGVAIGFTCRSRLPQLQGRRRGSLCGRLRLTDASATCNHKRGRWLAPTWCSRVQARAHGGQMKMVVLEAMWSPHGGAHENKAARSPLLTHAAPSDARAPGKSDVNLVLKWIDTDQIKHQLKQEARIKEK